jgi:arabinofuranosyltransferase
MRFESTSRFAPWVAALCTLVVGALAWPFTVDDAYIVGRYASRLASGHGYTMNDGPPTDGITGPLWIVPGYLARSIGGDPIAAAKAVGLACAAVAVALLIAQVRHRAVGSRAVWTATAFLACSATVGIWASAGLETGAAMLVTTAALIATVRRPEPSGLVLGVAGAMIAWLRPEAVPGVLVLAGMAMRRHRTQGALALGIALAGLAAVAAFRLEMFGTALPLSVSAKPSDLANGAGYLGRGAILALGIAGVVPAFVAVRQSRSLRVPATMVLVHLASVLLAGGDWMPGFRLFAPALPAYAWLVGVGVSDLARRPAIGGRGALALAVVVCAIPAIDLAIELPAVRAAGAARETVGQALAAELRARAHRVALVDIGYLGYASDLAVVDLAGVTDPSIGHLEGRHGEKPVSFAILAQRDVDAIVLHSITEPRVENGTLRSLAGFRVERELAADEGLVRTFEVAHVVRYGDGYWYVLLLRRADAP